MKLTTPVTLLALCAITADSFLPGLASAPRFASASASAAHKKEVGHDEAPVAKQQEEQTPDKTSGKIARPIPGAVWPMRRMGSLLDFFDELEASMFGEEDSFFRTPSFWRQQPLLQQQQQQQQQQQGEQQEGGGALQHQQQPNKGLSLSSPRWGMPAMGHLDLAETDQDVKVTVDLPGIKKEDIHVELTKDLLTITAERKAEAEEKGKTFTRQERSYGMVKRAVRVPDSVDTSAGDVHADFKDGVLHLTLKKSEHAEPTSPRRIEIQ